MTTDDKPGSSLAMGKGFSTQEHQGRRTLVLDLDEPWSFVARWLLGMLGRHLEVTYRR